jgi:hypothetical protein
MSIGFVTVAALCLLLGRQVTRVPATASFLPVVWFLAGAFTLHALLLALAVFDLQWRWLTLGLPVAALLAITWWMTARRPRAAHLPTAPGWDPGWGDLFAVLALAVFAVFAYNSWVTTPDFFLHWGRKGTEFFHAGRLDYAFLSRPWNWRIVPSYPTLLSELYALTAVFSGSFRESEMMLWTVLWLVLILLSARETFERTEVPWSYGKAALALLATAMAAAAIALHLAGGADWMIALALVAALPDLVGPPRRVSRQLCALDFAAAFAVSAKDEGILLAALLLAASAIRDRLARGRWGTLRLVRSVTPSLVVGGLWFVQNLRYGLRPSLLIGGPAGGRVQVVASEVLSHLASPRLSGLELWILALPLLLIDRRTRWVGGVVGIQLLLNLCVYVGAVGDTRFLVSSTVDRLLWQILPAVVVGAVVALLARPTAGSDEPDTPTAGGTTVG